MPASRKALLFLVSLTTVLTLNFSAQADTRAFCRVAKQWMLAEIENLPVDAGDVCRSYGRGVCSARITFGDLFCRASPAGDTCEGVGIGEGICEAGGGGFCQDVGHAEGICRAGRASYCWDTTVGEALCKVNKANFCLADTSVAEAICLGGTLGSCYNIGLGEGICRGANGEYCFDLTVGEGLCKAAGISIRYCRGVSIAQGLCLAIGGSPDCVEARLADGIAQLLRFCDADLSR